MLTALHLGNFKAFGPTQRLPLRPLTLIFGPNSSGKSSLIHGLLLGAHAAATGDLDAHRTAAGGDAVDLGGFRRYVHRRDASQRTTWGVEIDPRQLTGRLSELLEPATMLKLLLRIGLTDEDDAGATPQVKQFEFLIDDKPALVYTQLGQVTQGTYSIPLFDQPFFQPIVQRVLSQIPDISAELMTELTSEITHLGHIGKFSAPGGIFLPGSQPALYGNQGMTRTQPIPSGNQRQDMIAHASYLLQGLLDDLLGDLSTAVTAQLKRLRYLGPLRSYPPRQIGPAKADDPNWYASGAYAWEAVRRDRVLRNAVNRWLSDSERLSTPYYLDTRTFFSKDAVYRTFLKVDSYVNFEDDIFVALDDTIEELGRSDPLAQYSELLLIDQRTYTQVSHRDIGIGVSQVLPVLVAAYGSEQSILAIEQPELHLHPALQAELGDVFLESALGKRANTLLLETHSEHLILRLMRRMRETAHGTLPTGLPPLRPQDVAILYVEPGGPGEASVVQELELDEEGQLLDPWPGGFFEEGFRERFGE